MFIFKRQLSRRTFLHGTGAMIALPFLDAMAPAQTPVLPGFRPLSPTAQEWEASASVGALRARVG